MFYVPDGTHRCGLYTCEKCGSRFLDIKVGPSLVCPYCGEEPDMPVISEDAKLVKMLEGEEEIEKYDQLLSLALTGGDYNWI